jgi:phosphopantetheine adenylyltransferase
MGFTGLSSALKKALAQELFCVFLFKSEACEACTSKMVMALRQIKTKVALVIIFI